jgi:hypothetical protein
LSKDDPKNYKLVKKIGVANYLNHTAKGQSEGLDQNEKIYKIKVKYTKGNE